MELLDKLKKMIPREKGKKVGVSRAGKSIDKRIIFFGGALVTSIVLMVIMFSLAARHTNHHESLIGFSSDSQVISQQILLSASGAMTGDSKAFESLATHQNRYLTTLGLLDKMSGAHSSSVFTADISGELAKLNDIWTVYDEYIKIIIAARNSIETVGKSAAQIKESLPELESLSNQVVKALVRGAAPQRNIALAASQLALLGVIDNSVNQIVTDGRNVKTAAGRLLVDARLIEKQLIAMLEGDASLGIKRFTGNLIVGKLVQFADLFSVVKRNLKQVLDSVKSVSNAHQAAFKLQSLGPDLLAASVGMRVKITSENDKLQFLRISGYGLGFLALLMMLFLALIQVRQSQLQLIESQDQNDRNQRAILRLLDEMTNLADGDLSTHTTVTEDITGAIADSVNYSIDALRELVGTINKTAVQVSGAVRITQGATSRLEQESVLQAREIVGASTTITQISESMSNVSKKAADSAEVARKSVRIAHQGGETVRQAISGMETIRGQIQETSKRIKRLGESSQEIGDIVNLITEISDQTNILALNAAIQASMAGEAGRGFAVVADEVQRLAERTGDATKQIEALVKTIQADTNEATASMEQSTANVVKGARLTENAGSALDKIEQVSMNLAQRILEISDATKLQAAESVKITETMDVIQQITMKTSKESGQASDSIGELSKMVKAMHKSVAGFKLPGIGATDSAVLDATELNLKKQM